MFICRFFFLYCFIVFIFFRTSPTPPRALQLASAHWSAEITFVKLPICPKVKFLLQDYFSPHFFFVFLFFAYCLIDKKCTLVTLAVDNTFPIAIFFPSLSSSPLLLLLLLLIHFVSTPLTWAFEFVFIYTKKYIGSFWWRFLWSCYWLQIVRTSYKMIEKEKKGSILVSLRFQLLLTTRTTMEFTISPFLSLAN